MESSKPQFADVVYFYGCMQGVEGHTEAGHYWRSSDGSEPPRTTNPWGRYPDGTLCPEGGQAQGAAILHQKNGWTAIGFWDRTGDSRGNSNSNFLVNGTYTFDEMCKLAQEAYPALWKRIGSVRHSGTNCPDIQGFWIRRVDDEHVEIKLHGHDVASLSHDSDGWDGIEKAEGIVTSIAGILSIPVRKE
jgi:hypothetical protein